MQSSATDIQPRIWISAAILALFFCALWLPAQTTPFWGDDYIFLSDAHAANLTGHPWWTAFWPDVQSKFWRPLSQETFWRFVDSALAGDPRSAHMLNLGLLILASCSVGVLGAVLAHTCEWPSPLGTGILGALVYGSLSLHLLPVHWVSAANSSILVVWSALCLAAWLTAPQSGRIARTVLSVLIPALLLGALLSKESAVLLPLLMLVLTVFVAPRARPGRAEFYSWFACWAIIAVWLVLRSRFTSTADAEYSLVFGTNLVRNAMSLVAWLLNIPREGMRMMLSGEAIPAMLWSAAVALLMLIVWAIVSRPLSQELSRRRALAAVAFILLAYAPYFPLAWNSYAYYAAIASILPALLLARGLVSSRFAHTGAALIGLSSLIAVQGTRWLDHPGLIGRAYWADATLAALEKETVLPPLFVLPADDQRFYAMGAAGLAWRLGLNREDIYVVNSCPDRAIRCLVIAADGQWSWAQSD